MCKTTLLMRSVVSLSVTAKLLILFIDLTHSPLMDSTGALRVDCRAMNFSVHTRITHVVS